MLEKLENRPFENYAGKAGKQTFFENYAGKAGKQTFLKITLEKLENRLRKTRLRPTVRYATKQSSFQREGDLHEPIMQKERSIPK